MSSSSPPQPAKGATRGVVLLSGGLDSVTLLALARSRGVQCWALSFDYGQRHRAELDAARRQAIRHGVQGHEIVALSDLGRLVAGATALVRDGGLAVPKEAHGDVTPADPKRPAEPDALGRRRGSEIPTTYVPARNTVFLAYALAWAEVLLADGIWIGVNAVDFSGYPDCRPAFIDAFERLARLATRAGDEASQRGGAGAGISIHAPLIGLSKADIIATGSALGVDYADTVTCYDPAAGEEGVVACGACESCRLRREGFAAAGLADPAVYA